MMTLYEWAQRWSISLQAMNELVNMSVPDAGIITGESEATVQNKIRGHAPIIGNRLWRNNNGAGKNDRGDYMRWGLGNDSQRVNKYFKSSDLVGMTSMVIQPHHVGRKLGVFTTVEVKQAGWKWSGNETEQAQLKFINVVKEAGGIGCFAQSIEDYTRCLHEFG